MPNALSLLGYPADSKLLLIHADDLGLCHSVNIATFNALTENAISSTSLMVPAIGFQEAVLFAQQHPDLDLGIHWTLTSEWPNSKWEPVLPNLPPGLTDESGHFLPRFQFTDIEARQAEAELTAQLQLALRCGVNVTHVDSHMLTLLQCPESIDVYTRVARHYRIPFFLPADFAACVTCGIDDNDILVNRVFSARPALPDQNWMNYYLAVLRSIQPGLSQLTVHLGFDDGELRSITGAQRSWGSAWRQRDYDVIMSPEFREAVRQNDIQVVTWYELSARKNARSVQAERETERYTSASSNSL